MSIFPGWEAIVWISATRIEQRSLFVLSVSWQGEWGNKDSCHQSWIKVEFCLHQCIRVNEVSVSRVETQIGIKLSHTHTHTPRPCRPSQFFQVGGWVRVGDSIASEIACEIVIAGASAYRLAHQSHPPKSLKGTFPRNIPAEHSKLVWSILKAVCFVLVNVPIILTFEVFSSIVDLEVFRDLRAPCPKTIWT